MSNLNAFFIQYQVNKLNLNGLTTSQGIATIIVFAEDERTARSRAGRMICSKNLEITEFLRIHLVQESYVELLDSVLRSLYNQAELYGVAIHYDLFPSNTSWHNIKHNQSD